MIKNVGIMLFCLPSIMNAEFLIYKVDADNLSTINVINYVSMSPDEREKLHTLYLDTIYKYQFPTVKLFYEKFTPEEKGEYLESLKKPRGLFNFIKNKVETVSQKKYSLVWVPTTVFDLCALSIFIASIQGDRDLLRRNPLNECQSMPKDFIVEAKRWLDLDCSKFLLKNFVMSHKLLVVDQNNCHLKLYFIASDYILKMYRNHGLFMQDVGAGNKKEIINFIVEVGKMLEQYTYAEELKRDYPLYDPESLPIIERYLNYEQIACENNQFILTRGTNGYGANGKESHKDMTVLDYQMGGEVGLSYGYSLFAGSIFERTTYPNPARAMDYMMTCNLGYILLINIEDVFTKEIYIFKDSDKERDQNFFQLPELTAIQELFGYGEDFHPRLRKSVFKKIPVVYVETIIQQWSSYLSKAKIVKFATGGDSSKILKEDIEFQKEELLQAALQMRIAIELEETKMRDDIFNNMKKEELLQAALPMKIAIELEETKMRDDIFNNMKKEELLQTALPMKIAIELEETKMRDDIFNNMKKELEELSKKQSSAKKTEPTPKYAEAVERRMLTMALELASVLGSGLDPFEFLLE